MGEPDSNVPLGILGHRAESERLAQLTAFLSAFAPSPGRAYDPGRAIDTGQADELIAARGLAVLRCFAAVARLADMSFVEPPSCAGQTTPGRSPIASTNCEP